MANKSKYVKASIHKRREWMKALKDNKPCADCGVPYRHYVLDWHHLDPATKAFSIGKHLTRHGRASIEAEMQKCVLICANCHRERHRPQ